MSHKPQIMVVDDDHAICEFLRMFLDGLGYRSTAVNDAEQAIEMYSAERPDAVIIDVIMPGSMDGLGALAAFKKIDRDVPVIVMSGQGRTATVVQAMKLGAFDFVGKPFDETDLEALLADALRQRRLNRDVSMVRNGLQHPNTHPMVSGDSPEMREVKELIERVAGTDVTVLIRGESGTGKELIARALYAASVRRDKPFVKVNCAALPTELLESELFGFEKGAFTGAIQHKPGKFEFANHGTMFLDEIGDMSFPLQAKLLQALQDGEFSRLGGKSDVRVDVRVITATNCDLEAAVASGRFREDLYFRLNVVTITIPPLRDRREEIPMLTEHFVKKYSVQYNKPFPGISHELSALFLEYEWPGNVRQLENLIKRMVVLGSEAPIVQELKNPSCTSAPRATAPPLQPVIPPPAAAAVAIAPASLAATAPAMVGAGAMMAGAPAAIGIGSVAAVAAPAGASAAVNVSLKDIARTAAREAERELILRMLTRTRWNRKEAAEILGISYKALLYKIKENGLDKAS